jgi:hypothetical protein
MMHQSKSDELTVRRELAFVKRSWDLLLNSPAESLLKWMSCMAAKSLAR